MVVEILRDCSCTEIVAFLCFLSQSTPAFMGLTYLFIFWYIHLKWSNSVEIKYYYTLSETQYEWTKIEPVPMKANFIHSWCVESEFMVKNKFHNWTSDLVYIWYFFTSEGCVILEVASFKEEGLVMPEGWKGEKGKLKI